MQYENTRSQTTKYRVIFADPPWRFSTYSYKGKGRSAEAHYDCMSLDDLVRMAPVIQKMAAPDCVLFMWTTDPMLVSAIGLMQGWGFEYKTIGFVWAKSRKGYHSVSNEDHPIGTGYWTRANPELCLLATRGKPARLSRSVRELIVAPRREHSRKPDEIYDRIEALCEGPYLEMFARFPRVGWDRIGAQEGVEQRRWKSNGYPEEERANV